MFSGRSCISLVTWVAYLNVIKSFSWSNLRKYQPPPEKVQNASIKGRNQLPSKWQQRHIKKNMLDRYMNRSAQSFLNFHYDYVNLLCYSYGIIIWNYYATILIIYKIMTGNQWNFLITYLRIIFRMKYIRQ